MNGHRWNGSDLTVDFTDGRAAVEFVEAVVDLNASQEVIGFEILGLIARHPLLPERINRPAGSDSGTRVACDPSADAIYVRFGLDRSVDQVVRPAAVVLGPDDSLITIVVRME